MQLTWAIDNENVAALINCALILCADHELNASSFTARCAASAGATVYAVVNGGLSTLQGYRHGGSTERVEVLFGEVATKSVQTFLDRLKPGEAIPGFGHQLYPQGDPRAQFLLKQIEASNTTSPILQNALSMIDTVERAVQLKLNIDFALVALKKSYGLPEGSPPTLFALGRIAGWIGDAIEQYQCNRLICPHARYVGKHPTL